MAVFELGRAAALSLEELDLGSDRLDGLFKFLHGPYGRLRTGVIGMVGQLIQEMGLALGLDGLEDLADPVDRFRQAVQAESRDRHVLVVFADGLRSVDVQVRARLHVLRREFRFIPDLVHRDLTLVALGHGFHILLPGLHGFLVRKDGGTEIDRALVVDGIAVTETHPGFYTPFDKAVYDVVEPGEVVLALFLFGLGPSALQAGVADAEFHEIVLELVKIREVPVKGLAADGPPVLLAEIRSLGDDFSDLRKTGCIRLHFFIRDGRFQRGVLRPGGQECRSDGQKQGEGKDLFHTLL